MQNPSPASGPSVQAGPRGAATIKSPPYPAQLVPLCAGRDGDAVTAWGYVAAHRRRRPADPDAAEGLSAVRAAAGASGGP